MTLKASKLNNQRCEVPLEPEHTNGMTLSESLDMQMGHNFQYAVIHSYTKFELLSCEIQYN